MQRGAEKEPVNNENSAQNIPVVLYNNGERCAGQKQRSAQQEHAVADYLQRNELYEY